MQLDGKIAIVTGSTQGIGRGIALRFASEGATAIIAGRNKDKGQAVVEEIRELGGRAAYIKTDVSVEDDVESMVSTAIRDHGRIDILVNNAGGTGDWCRTPFFELSTEQWQCTIGVNLTGMFLCSRAAARHMIGRRQGKIVNIASVHSYATAPGTADYAAAKGGVIQLTRAMAIDLAPYDIRVNAIAPGAISIERMPESDYPEDVMNDYILLKRWGTVHEIASLALFLCADESSYINGETITIDGGLRTLLPGEPIWKR
jgi:3-oxoacyl-[acyl-carrier protein] reductase